MGTERAEMLAAMIEEACVDAHDDEEQLTGLFTMIEENLELPFDTVVLGVSIRVVSIEMTDSGRLKAICQGGGQSQRVSLEDLPLPSRRPAGADWIDAYRVWNQNR